METMNTARTLPGTRLPFGSCVVGAGGIESGHTGGEAMSVEAILRQVDELTAAEREQLFERLHAKYPAVEATPELAALLAERVVEADANPGQRYTWDEVVAYVRRGR